MNIHLGPNYRLLSREENPDGFRRQSILCWGEAEPETIYAFIMDSSGNPYPLFKEEYNYIMTADGNTFSNVTQK